MPKEDEYILSKNLLNSSGKSIPSISFLQFPFSLKEDQLAAVSAWVNNNFRGTILYSTGTGKTEIAFECAKVRSSYPFSYFNGDSSLGSDNITGIGKEDTLDSTVVVSDKKNYVNELERKEKKIGYELGNSNDNDNDDNNDDDYVKTARKGNTNVQKNNSIIQGTNPYVKDRDLENQKKLSEKPQISFFNILFLVPRISLIDQTIRRLVSYGIPKDSIGAYFGERKEKKEIMISTYQSVIKNLDLVKRSNMVIFDEVHMVKDTAKSFTKIFDVVVEDPHKAILGLTATLDEGDFKNKSIMAVLPPVIKYSIKDAVGDQRLAKPIVVPIKVHLTPDEENDYDLFSSKIKNISGRFKRYDAGAMTDLLKKGGFASGMAKAWFSNVRKRKLLLSCAETKLSAAADVIAKRFPEEKIMVFSETLESIERLYRILDEQNIKSKIINAKIKTSGRQKILDNWGSAFNVLLSVHTLEIGYDVPDVRIEIILATTSNMNQVIQRIGRVIRKKEGKDIALIYVIYVSDTKDDNIIELIKKALKDDSAIRFKQQSHHKTINSDHKHEEVLKSDKNGRRKELAKNRWYLTDQDSEGRIGKAYNLIESNLRDPIIIEQKIILPQHEDKEEKEEKEKVTNNINSVGTLKQEQIKTIYRVQSSKDKTKIYDVDIQNETCTCPDYTYRKIKCKHIIATELILP